MASFMVPAAGGTAAVLAGVLVAGSGSGLSSALALTIASCIGNSVSCVLICIPLKTFVEPIMRGNTVGNRTPYGHVLMLATAAAWGLYASITYKESRISTIINAICFVFQLIYVLVFIRYAQGMARWTAVALLLTALIGSGVLAWVVIVKVIDRHELDRSTIATIASAVSCVTYAAVGYDIAVVACSKDVSNMDPLVEVLLNILIAGASVYYAFLSSPVDKYIGVPNAIGVVILLVQLVVFVMHCKAKPEDEEEAPQTVQAPQTVEEAINNASNSTPDYGSDLGAMFASPDALPEPEIAPPV
ncbi:bidirectional sugar transporter SWEET2a-like [Lolium perenne]|uniref:bidirectional sugar transporter SWEET2a-like n=1 Tax=Lolium perenne TaxID=4522 RepID=UPI0021F5204E|nr:bidirectional sugar transporter SWEET5-like [Lolium perenne]XP_051190009.1 bidirectional sugar transporter SWEET5-like [Lolium perenne]XP_051190010.1 bidirectional sugar transporter SWEET5-like [Lolium perenne]